MADNKFNQRKDVFMRAKLRAGIADAPKTTIVFCKNCPEKVVAVVVADNYAYERLCVDCAVKESAIKKAQLMPMTNEETRMTYSMGISGVIVLFALLGLAVMLNYLFSAFGIYNR